MEFSDSKTDGENSKAESEENRGPANIEVETNIKGGTFHFKGKKKRKKEGRRGKNKKEKDRFLYPGLSGPSHLKGSSYSFEGGDAWFLRRRRKKTKGERSSNVSYRYECCMLLPIFFFR